MVASYFYLRTRSSDWPPGVPPPALTWSVANGILLLFSIAPAVWIKRQARAARLIRCRIGLIVLALFGAASLALRVYEFPALNCKWSDNAYGAVVWALLGV